MTDLEKWNENHPGSGYYVPDGATCDTCQCPLTDEERLRNILENEEQDGNTLSCDRCAKQCRA